MVHCVGVYIPKTNFLGQASQKLEHYRQRQHRLTKPHPHSQVG